MKMGKIIILLIAVFTLIGVSGYSQKKFSVTVNLSKKLINQKVEITYDNGKIVKPVQINLQKGMMVISDSFYSKFATIIIHVSGFNISEEHRFIVTEKPAIISLYTPVVVPRFRMMDAYVAKEVRKFN